MANGLLFDLGDFIHALDNKTFFEVLSRAAQSIGFEHCSYGFRLPVPVAQPKTIILSNYTDAWHSRYLSENYVAIDPTVAHGLNSVLPLQWSTQVFDECPDFWEDAAAHGLRSGWAQSCCGRTGAVGMLTLAHSAHSLPTQAKASDMMMLNQMAHERFSQLQSEQAAWVPVPLNSREVEVLRWTADGKTAGEVADILNLTERTVTFHMGQAMGKLNVPNKVAAVVRAAALGLI